VSASQARLFCFDLASPLCYLAAERALQTLPGPVEWLPVCAADLPNAERFEAFRCETEAQAFREDVERRADELMLPPVRWPQPFPFDSEAAMRAAIFAKGIGKTVAFAQAAFRQAFAGGHALDSEDFVLIAAAACEMHPQSAIASQETTRRLRTAGRLAASHGVCDLPAVVVDGEVFTGERALEDAGRRIAATPPAEPPFTLEVSAG
jgi:2-hydroxychromene-2-carboxylate isomerase